MATEKIFLDEKEFQQNMSLLAQFLDKHPTASNKFRFILGDLKLDQSIIATLNLNHSSKKIAKKILKELSNNPQEYDSLIRKLNQKNSEPTR